MLVQSAGALEYTDCVTAECPAYDTKQSDGEALGMLELWGMRSTPSLPLLPGWLWPEVLAPDRVLSIGQIDLFDLKTERKQIACLIELFEM